MEKLHTQQKYSFNRLGLELLNNNNIPKQDHGPWEAFACVPITAQFKFCSVTFTKNYFVIFFIKLSFWLKISDNFSSYILALGIWIINYLGAEQIPYKRLYGLDSDTVSAVRPV